MKEKYPCWLTRVIIRLYKQGLGKFFMIVYQECRFGRLLKNCKLISIDDFYKILLDDGLVQIRPTDGQFIKEVVDEDKHDVKNLKDRFRDNISNKKSTKTSIDVDDGTFIKGHESMRCVVTVKNLLICTHEEGGVSMHQNIIGFDVYEQGQFRVTDIVFIDCIFMKSMDKDSIRPDESPYWKLEKFENSLITFTNCIFRGIRLAIHQKSGPIQSIESMCVEFSNSFSISTNDGIFIDALVDNRRCKVTEHDAFDRKGLSLSNMLINDCQFEYAWVSTFNLSLRGKNVVKHFRRISPPGKIGFFKKGRKLPRISTNEPDGYAKYKVYWGPYQAIVPSDSDWEGHRTWLLELKATAEKKEDSAQKDILSREIMKCDRELIRQEPWLTSWQDRLTLWFNATFSNYGISWVRPLMLLCAVNFLYSLLTACLSLEGWSGWGFLHTFLESFNPLSIPESGSEKAGISALLLGAGLVQKFFFVVCVYEIIRAGRRFSRS